MPIGPAPSTGYDPIDREGRRIFGEASSKLSVPTFTPGQLFDQLITMQPQQPLRSSAAATATTRTVVVPPSPSSLSSSTQVLYKDGTAGAHRYIRGYAGGEPRKVTQYVRNEPASRTMTHHINAATTTTSTSPLRTRVAGEGYRPAATTTSYMSSPTKRIIYQQPPTATTSTGSTTTANASRHIVIKAPTSSLSEPTTTTTATNGLVSESAPSRVIRLEADWQRPATTTTFVGHAIQPQTCHPQHQHQCSCGPATAPHKNETLDATTAAWYGYYFGLYHCSAMLQQCGPQQQQQHPQQHPQQQRHPPQQQYPQQYQYQQQHPHPHGSGGCDCGGGCGGGCRRKGWYYCAGPPAPKAAASTPQEVTTTEHTTKVKADVKDSASGKTFEQANVPKKAVHKEVEHGLPNAPNRKETRSERARRR